MRRSISVIGGSDIVARLYARNRSKLIACLRVAKAALAADDNIEAGRQAIPIVARLRMATRWNGVAAKHGAGHLARRPLALGGAVFCRLLLRRRGQHGVALGLRRAGSKNGTC